MYSGPIKSSRFKRLIALIICLTFVFSNLQQSQAQEFSVNQLPVPGTMIGESPAFAPLALKGLAVNPHKPLEFQFIVDTGNGSGNVASVKNEANRLVKYFLAGLTIPEGELWVNLSPYEKNRITTSSLGQTELGRDLLAQDYILKQLTASLIYPEKDLGKEFWSRVYAKAQQQFGTTNVPVNTFNKVWILPDQAQVYEHGAAAYITKSTLKVMLDEDYLALQKHITVRNDTNSIGATIVRQIILPEIIKEVNTGKNFASLRQIYDAMILAKWYKETFENGLLDAVYTNKNKTAGVNLTDPSIKEQIYQRYLKAYKKGVFNFIKDDLTPGGEYIPRKYFSGGITNIEPRRVSTDGAMSAVKSIGLVLALTVSLITSSPVHAQQQKPINDGKTIIIPDSVVALKKKLLEVKKEWEKFSPETRAIIDYKTLHQISTLINRDIVWKAVFSPNGKWVAMSGYDGTVKIWDVQKGELIRTLRGFGAAVNGIAWSPDGNKLAIASYNNIAQIFDLKTGKTVTLKGNTYGVNDIAFSPDGSKVATSSYNMTASIWDAQTGDSIHTLKGHTDRVRGIAWSPDGKYLATASYDKTAKIWNAQTGTVIDTLKGHTGFVRGVAFSLDSKYVSTVSEDGTAKIWVVKTGDLNRTIIGHTGALWGVAFSPDARALGTVGEDGTVKFWDLQTGELIVTLIGHTSGVNGISFRLPSGEEVVTASNDGTAIIWAAAIKGIDTLTTQQEAKRQELETKRDSLLKAGLSVDTSMFRDTDAVSGAGLNVDTLTLKGHTGPLSGIAFSPDGSEVATASYDKTVKIWNVKTGKIIRTIQNNTKVNGVAWSPDGSKIAMALMNNTAKIQDLKTGKTVLLIGRINYDVNFAIAWSPDSKEVITSCDKIANIWNAQTGELIRTLTGHPSIVWSAAYSPDGQYVVTASDDKTANIWNAKTGQVLVTLIGHTGAVWGAAFSPDGTKVATVSMDGTAKIWSVKTGEELVTIIGHSGGLRRIAWSPDGTKVITAGNDGTAEIWLAQNGQALGALVGHQGPVWGVAWSADGNEIGTASYDETAKIWDVGTSKEKVSLATHTAIVQGTASSSASSAETVQSKDKAMLNVKVSEAKVDKAALAKNVGGIDLDRILIKRTGNVIKMEFDPAQLHQLMQGGFEGFMPVIVNITRISSPFQILGIPQ